MDKNINLDLHKKSNDELSDCFSVPSFIEASKPIKIFFIIPNISVNEPKEIKVSLDLIVNIEGNSENKCIIECQFFVQLLPLKIYISSSKGLLSLEKNIFKLNVGSILEYEEIDFKIEIPSFDKYNIFVSSYYLISYKDNTARCPYLNFDSKEKTLWIEIERYEENKNHLHFLICLSITEEKNILLEMNMIIHKKEFILTLVNCLDDYIDCKYNLIIYNKDGLKPSLKLDLLDEKETVIEIEKSEKIKNKKFNYYFKLKIKS